MKPRVAATGLALLLTSSAPAAAQVQPATPLRVAVGDWFFAPSVELRVRGEYRRDPPDVGGTDLAGAGGPAVPNLGVVSERARLGLRAERSQLRIQLTLQDARVFGVGRPEPSFPRGPRELGLFAPYEAYAEVHGQAAPDGRESFVRLGRQAIAWGEGVLLGHGDWTPTGTAFDALRGRWVLGHGELEAFAALLASPAPAGASFGDRFGAPSFGAQLYGLRVGWAFAPALKVEAGGLARVSNTPGLPTDGSRFAAARLEGETFTATVRVHGAADAFDYGVEGIAQGGRARGLGVDRRAFGVTARAGYTLGGLLGAPELRAVFSYATGDDGGGTYTQLDPLVPDVHDRFGAMDLFAFSNVVAPGARIAVTPWPALQAAVQYGYFRMATGRGEWLNAYLQAVAVGSGESGLGHEVDASVRYQPLGPLVLEAGYGLLALEPAGRALVAARGRPGTDLSHFAFLSAKVIAP